MTTPSQTVGPYLSIGLPWPDGPDVVPEGTPGASASTARSSTARATPIPDALIETWQADPDGKFGSDFRGFGRCAHRRRWRLGDLHRQAGRARRRPGAAHRRQRLRPRHAQPCVTRIYFADEDNAGDPVLASVPDDRRATLIAQPARRRLPLRRPRPGRG